MAVRRAHPPAHPHCKQHPPLSLAAAAAAAAHPGAQIRHQQNPLVAGGQLGAAQQLQRHHQSLHKVGVPLAVAGDCMQGRQGGREAGRKAAQSGRHCSREAGRGNEGAARHAGNGIAGAQAARVATQADGQEGKPAGGQQAGRPAMQASQSDSSPLCRDLRYSPSGGAILRQAAGA